MKNYIFIAVAAIAVLLWGGLAISHAAAVGKAGDVQVVAAQSAEATPVAVPTESAQTVKKVDDAAPVVTTSSGGSSSRKVQGRVQEVSPRDLKEVECLGDVNGDGSINFGDINPFTHWLKFAKKYPHIFKHVFPKLFERMNINGDNVVDGADVNPFVAMLSNGATCRPDLEVAAVSDLANY